MFIHASVKSQEYPLRYFPNYHRNSEFNGKIDPFPINQLIASYSLVGELIEIKLTGQ
jgi:hypothetical protein